jgi:ADP-heptose:LPS heptosyltransferase
LSANISLDDAATARAWFSEVVEPLADSFDAARVEEYVRMFAGVLEAVDPALEAGSLIERYHRVRRPRVYLGGQPDHVFVLSRVTLGADIAITSVLLDAAKQRFPESRIWYVGSRKGFELFAADPRVEHAPAPYDRTGSIRDRVMASQSLENLVSRARSITIDPDSRLTQLGLVPVCPEEEYFFFESRSVASPGSLAELTAQWAAATFGIPGAKPYFAVPAFSGPAPEITVSLGTGENSAKRLADPFERLLLERLHATGRSILVDQGAGGEESERVRRAAAGLAHVELFEGAFAAFASRIAASRLYIGYDSAGQHAAAAAGVSLIAIFAGYPSERFVERWRPTGPGRVAIVRGDRRDVGEVLHEVMSLASASISPR